MPAPSRSLARRASAVLLTSALLVSLGCSGSDDDTSTAGPTTAADDTSTSTADGGSEPTDPNATEGTDPETTAPAAASQPTAYTTTAADAVNELKAAWLEGDRARAEAIAPGDVVDALFAVAPESFEVYGCDTGEFPTSTCNYRNRSTGVFIKVSAARSDAGWQITTITVA